MKLTGDVTRSDGEPHDRLTRLCAAMTDALEAQPGTDDVKAIVMLQDAERGGLQVHGYEDQVEAMVDLLGHLQAIFEANGKTLAVAPLPVGRG